MTKTYRKGPVRALMDEYERAVGELVPLIEGLSDEEYEFAGRRGGSDPVRLEHMIVHVLLHRRQIERFLGRPQKSFKPGFPVDRK